MWAGGQRRRQEAGEQLRICETAEELYCTDSQWLTSCSVTERGPRKKLVRLLWLRLVTAAVAFFGLYMSRIMKFG